MPELVQELPGRVDKAAAAAAAAVQFSNGLLSLMQPALQQAALAPLKQAELLVRVSGIIIQTRRNELRTHSLRVGSGQLQPAQVQGQ